MRQEEIVLDVRGLSVTFRTDAGPLQAVSGVDLQLQRGRTTAVVGESGCGKTVTAMAILNLLPPSAFRQGCIRFGELDLASCSEAELRRVRGSGVSVVFQDAQTALNPVLTIGVQLTEVLRAHRKIARVAAWVEAVAMLRRVGIPEPELRMRSYPHQLSGGLKQRVMIAMALLCRPAVLIADEPTTALDVTIQAQILALLQDLQADPGLQMAILLITHDMGVVAEIAHEVVVMYAGQVVERGLVEAVLTSPRHPYTADLLRAVPVVGRAQEPLRVIAGQPPNLLQTFTGCRYAERCSRVEAQCRVALPPWQQDGQGWGMRCVLEVAP